MLRFLKRILSGLRNNKEMSQDRVTATMLAETIMRGEHGTE